MSGPRERSRSRGSGGEPVGVRRDDCLTDFSLLTQACALQELVRQVQQLQQQVQQLQQRVQLLEQPVQQPMPPQTDGS